MKLNYLTQPQFFEQERIQKAFRDSVIIDIDLNKSKILAKSLEESLSSGKTFEPQESSLNLPDISHLLSNGVNLLYFQGGDELNTYLTINLALNALKIPVRGVYEGFWNGAASNPEYQGERREDRNKAAISFVLSEENQKPKHHFTDKGYPLVTIEGYVNQGRKHRDIKHFAQYNGLTIDEGFLCLSLVGKYDHGYYNPLENTPSPTKKHFEFMRLTHI